MAITPVPSENAIPVGGGFTIPANYNIFIRAYNNYVYILYSDDKGATADLYVARYNKLTNVIEDLGCDSATSTPIVADIQIGSDHLAIDPVDGSVYIGYALAASYWFTKCRKWNGSAWVIFGVDVYANYKSTFCVYNGITYINAIWVYWHYGYFYDSYLRSYNAGGPSAYMGGGYTAPNFISIVSDEVTGTIYIQETSQNIIRLGKWDDGTALYVPISDYLWAGANIDIGNDLCFQAVNDVIYTLVHEVPKTLILKYDAGWTVLYNDVVPPDILATATLPVFQTAHTNNGDFVFASRDQNDFTKALYGRWNDSESTWEYINLNESADANKKFSAICYDAVIDQIYIGWTNISVEKGTLAIFGEGPLPPTDIRYYVSPTTAYWNNSANWSITSGGSGGASIPDSSMIACFDGGDGTAGQGQCLLDIPVSVNEIRMTQGYTGKVIQYGLSVQANNGNFDGGTFDGGPGNIQIDNTAYFCHTKFISTRNDLSVGEYFWYEDKHDGSFEKIIVSEEITINSTDIGRKYTTLHSTPDSTSDVLLNIIHGSAQEYGVDYYVDKNKLKWDDKNLEDIIEVGDSLRVIYSATEYTSGFFNNSGRVILNSDRGILNGGGVEFYDLTFRKDGTNNLYCQIDSSATVENMLYLQDGNLKGSDSTLYAEGNIYVTSIFGSKDSRNTATIEVNGDNYQELIVNNGGVLPTLAVNKSTPDHLKARGTGPISIFGDLVISDGTFHTGGLNLQVGSI